MSAKRQKIAKARREVVARILAERPRCEFPTNEVLIYGVGASPQTDNSPCPNLAVDVHEPHSRARGGSILDEANTRTLCREHHDLIHDNPAWAESVGLLRHSWDAP